MSKGDLKKIPETKHLLTLGDPWKASDKKNVEDRLGNLLYNLVTATIDDTKIKAIVDDTKLKVQDIPDKMAKQLGLAVIASNCHQANNTTQMGNWLRKLK
jgi:DNA-binding transcriptional regulator YbjK